MLLPRILTAVVGIPLILWLVHRGGPPFAAFTAALAVLALREYALMLKAGGRLVQEHLAVAGGGFVALAVAFSGPTALAAVPGVGLSHLAVTLVTAAALGREMLRKEHSLDRAALTVLGALFIGWPLGHIALLRESPSGEKLTFLLFISVWVTDSLAYIVGNLAGRRKLAPVLSPKKSWEGALGGFAGALAVLWAAKTYWLQDILGPGLALGLGVLVGVVGQSSDIAQSLVKRACGVKDSAALLPGHGGIFDRMDSFLLLTPLFYYAVALFGGR